jgi:hypothetical protein
MEINLEISISKLDGARRQIETAIRLYFDDGDPVPIHTLAAAAYSVLRDINEKRGGIMMLKDAWRFLDTPEAKEFKRYINQPDNFLKHADQDPDGTLVFNARWTYAMLFEASHKYCGLTGEWRPLMALFLIWFVAQEPQIFEKLPEFEGKFPTVALRQLPKDRRKFLSDFLSLATSRPPAM